MPTLHFDVRGMNCFRCASSVRQAIVDINGVTQAEVNLELGTAIVRTNTIDVTSLHIQEGIAKAGYTADTKNIQ